MRRGVFRAEELISVIGNWPIAFTLAVLNRREETMQRHR
jgi:hypothetical protein